MRAHGVAPTDGIKLATMVCSRPYPTRPASSTTQLSQCCTGATGHGLLRPPHLEQLRNVLYFEVTCMSFAAINIRANRRERKRSGPLNCTERRALECLHTDPEGLSP